MLARFWLLFYCLCAVALPPASMAVAVERIVRAAESRTTQLAVGENEELGSDDQLASERAELPSGVGRLSSPGLCPGEEESHRVTTALAQFEGERTDLVRCRRLAGEQLLGYATPPPARA